MNISWQEPVAAASAATANKVTAGGFGVIVMGWLSNTTNIALIGLALTLIGFVWGRIDACRKRKEEAKLFVLAEEEHALRMKVMQAELKRSGGA